ncbi:hypothetical protein BU16DRAFT_534145 [Lophium mytilinum]|uniref:RING-type domain-containing protein n=1 Tax=Lophium mytilinum TaxID=390894 RepID=A0A6A6RCM0_9PEZI|nr:hypothetical protein BU16DRAFT_534145 [Lophium mytilinum]
MAPDPSKQDAPEVLTALENPKYPRQLLHIEETLERKYEDAMSRFEKEVLRWKSLGLTVRLLMKFNVTPRPTREDMLKWDLPANISLDTFCKEASALLDMKIETMAAFQAVVKHNREHESENRVETVAFMLWRLRALYRQLATDTTFGVEKAPTKAAEVFEGYTRRTAIRLYNEFHKVSSALFTADPNRFTAETVMENADPDIQNLNGIATEMLLTEANADVCPICLETWNSEHIPYRLDKCKHIVGELCMVTWLNSARRTSNLCVKCRAEIMELRPRRPKPARVQRMLAVLFTLLEELYYIFGLYKPVRTEWLWTLKYIEDNVRFMRDDPETNAAWAAGYRVAFIPIPH